MEPPQNRRQGDGFTALEFVQEPDPDLKKLERQRVLKELGEKL
jgi:hypothetical protein